MTHPAAELLRAIADGKQMEETFPNKWVECEPNRALLLIMQGRAHEVRIARPMVTRQVSYPEPLRVKPLMGQQYWVALPNYESTRFFVWRDDNQDHIVFNAGMAFATEADAAEAHKALFGVGT